MMVGRRQKPFFEMVRLLRAIEADQEDFASVKALNLLVLKEIIRAERKQDEHRAAVNAGRISGQRGGVKAGHC